MKATLFGIFMVCCTAAHAACGNGVFTGNGIDCSELVDLDFDIGLDGATYAFCDGASNKAWKALSTPDVYNWCRTELFTSSNRNIGRLSGVCNSGSAKCADTRTYCAQIGGAYTAGVGC